MNLKFNINLKDTETRNINNLAIPLLLNSITAIFISLIDQAMIGRISMAAFGAVGMVSSTVNSITGVLGMSAIAVNILGARQTATDNTMQGVTTYVTGNLILSSLIGILLVIISNILGENILIAIYGLKGNVLTQGNYYLSVFSLSIGLNMIIFTFSSYFKIINKTRYVLYGNVTASLINIVINYVLIFGRLGFPRLGTTGAALGSVIALSINILLYVIFYYRQKGSLCIFDRNIVATIKDIIKVSIPLMGQELLEDTLLVILINYILYSIGLLEVSVYNLVFSVISIALMPMYSYSQATLTLVSKYKGQNNKSINNIPYKAILMTYVFYISITLIMILGKDFIPRFITDDIDLINASVRYIPIVVIINITNILQHTYKQALQGISEEKWVFNISLLLNGLGFTLIYFLSIHFKLGLTGVYIGMMLNYLQLYIVFKKRFKLMI